MGLGTVGHMRLCLLSGVQLRLKFLVFFLGPFATEEDNWCPRITAVQNVSWSLRQRSLSIRGMALVINALAL